MVSLKSAEDTQGIWYLLLILCELRNSWNSTYSTQFSSVDTDRVHSCSPGVSNTALKPSHTSRETRADVWQNKEANGATFGSIFILSDNCF